MAFTPISNTFIQHSAQASGTSAAGYFLKLYAAGTNTPISTALDSAGSVLVAKTELDSLGFAQNGSGGATTLFIDQSYRLVLYVNATDADNNTFGNAVQDIDDIPQIATLTGSGETVKSFATLAAAVADTNLLDGDALNIAERTTGNGGGAMWDVVLSSTVTENTYNIVQATGVGTLSLVARTDDVVNARQFGANDGIVTNVGAIQAAIDFASTNGKTVFIPAGTYLLTVPLDSVWEGAGSMFHSFTIKSNMDIRGELGTILKIADNTSTDGAPVQLSMFFSNSQLTNISFRNLVLDMNGANNSISPLRPTTYARSNMAQIFFSGTIGGIAARADDVLITECELINTPGVTCIAMAQTNVAGTVLGERWVIKNCLFNNNGLDTDDHSSIFGWANDVIIDGCTFTADTMHGTVGSTGGLVACEIHGANQRFVNNKVKNYNQGMWVSDNQTSDTDNVIISGNTYSPVKEYGVGFFRESAAAGVIRKILIDGNTVGLTDDSTAVDIKAGFLISSAFSVQDIVISNNIVSKIGTSESSALVNITPQTEAGETHTMIKIDGNYCTGTTFGVIMATNTTNGLGNITITNNDFVSLDDTAAFADIAGIVANIVGSNTIDSLTIDGNNTIDPAGNTDRGVFLEKGTITDLYLGTNSYFGMTNENYTEGASLVVTNRHGYYPTFAFTPTWNSGTAITLGNGTVSGQFTKQDELIFYTAKLVVGSTTTFPGGTVSVSLPVVAATSGVNYQGTYRIIDGGVTRHLGQVAIDGTGSTAVLEQDGATFVTDISPITLANTDEIYITVTYRVTD